MSAPRPLRQRQHALDHVLLGVVDGVLGAARPHEGAFVRAARGADHARAGQPRHVDQRGADAAGRAIDHDGLRRDAARGVVQQDDRELVVGQRGRLVGADAVRQRPRRLLRHRGIFGVEPAAVADLVAGDEHLLPDLERGDARAERRDMAAHLVAQHERQLRHPAVAAGADHGVEVIHADGVGLDQHLARSGRRRRHLDKVEHVGAAGAADLDGFHRRCWPGVNSTRSWMRFQRAVCGGVMPHWSSRPGGHFQYSGP